MSLVALVNIDVEYDSTAEVILLSNYLFKCQLSCECLLAAVLEGYIVNAVYSAVGQLSGAFYNKCVLISISV